MVRRGHVLIFGASVLAACAPSSAETPRASPAGTQLAASPPRSAGNVEPTAPAAASATTSAAPSTSAPSTPSTAQPPARIRRTPHARGETRCVQSLASFCAPRSCPTWEAALAETMKSAEAGYTPETCSGIGGGDVAIGTCGRYRFVEDGDCLSGLTRYFDAKGTLVGVYAWSDAKRSCGFATIYGDVPKCS